MFRPLIGRGCAKGNTEKSLFFYDFFKIDRNIMKTEKIQLKRSTLTESYFGCILLYNLFIYMYT